MASKLKQKAAKAAAAATAEPGAYVKQQVVELSVANEAKIRALLQVSSRHARDDLAHIELFHC